MDYVNLKPRDGAYDNIPSFAVPEFNGNRSTKVVLQPPNAYRAWQDRPI